MYKDVIWAIDAQRERIAGKEESGRVGINVESQGNVCTWIKRNRQEGKRKSSICVRLCDNQCLRFMFAKGIKEGYDAFLRSIGHSLSLLSRGH
jgi:hypothetical protein